MSVKDIADYVIRSNPSSPANILVIEIHASLEYAVVSSRQFTNMVENKIFEFMKTRSVDSSNLSIVTRDFKVM